MWKRAVAGVLLAIIVLSLGIACTSEDEKPLSPTVSELEGSYEDALFSFSIHYPPEWSTVQGDAGEAMFTIRNSTSSCVVQIFVEPVPSGTSNDEWAKTALDTVQPKVTNFRLLSKGSIRLGEETGYEHIFTGDDSGIQITVKLLSLVQGTEGFVIVAASESDIYELLKETINNTVYSFRVGKSFLADLTREDSLFLADLGPITLDPAVMRDTASAYYIMEIFSGLVTLDRDLNVVPDLAESHEVSADGTVYTFRIRENARFHSGKELTAADVKYSLERACDPATGSQTAASYLGDIVGVNERLSGKADEISGVRVVDARTIEITIDAPKAYFLSKLVYPTAFVVDKANVESGTDWWRNPNGSGPFRLVAWEKDDILVLGRNDLYYGEMPRLKNVVYRLWAGVPMTMYENGEIDITSSVDIQRALDPLNPLNRELVTGPSFDILFVGFNAARPPFDDAKVRQAFCYAVDKDKIVKVLLQNTVKRADGILPPGMPGYNEALRGLQFDPEKARELISESKYGSVSNLTPITFTTSGLGESSPLYEAIIGMWKENLGVNVEIRQIDPEKYPYVIDTEKDELFEIGWAADYPDPQNFLDLLFHTGNTENTGEYSNPAVDSLLDAAREETDETARLSLYQEAEQMLVDDAACLPLFFGQDYTLVKPYVKGFVSSPLPIPWLKYISIEPVE